MKKFFVPIYCAWAISFAVLGWLLISRHKAEAIKECPGCALGSSPGLSLSPGEHFPKIPGDPQTAVLSFRHLYQAMVTFRAIHGRLPTPRELKDLSHPIAPGIQLRVDDLENKDGKTPEYVASQGEPNITYWPGYASHRPDGTRKPAYPRKGEKDLWFLSRQYMRSIGIGQGKDAVLKHYGVLVGLFSDGEIEIRPMDQLVAVRLASNAMKIDFPDETGLPKDTHPVNETLQQLVIAPRGPARSTPKR